MRKFFSFYTDYQYVIYLLNFIISLLLNLSFCLRGKLAAFLPI